MRISIINEDQTMVIDGKALRFKFDLNDKIHAIQWYGESGEVEYKNHSTRNKKIKSFTPYQFLIDGYNNELLRIKEKRQKEKEEIILVNDEVSEKATLSTLWERIRHRRTGLLATTDWTQLLDTSLTPECIQAFATYRQKLRDIPQTYQAPDEALWRANKIHWPSKPEEVKKV